MVKISQVGSVGPEQAMVVMGTVPQLMGLVAVVVSVAVGLRCS